MLDNIKFLIHSQEIINRVISHPDFCVCRPKTNGYHSLLHKDFGAKLSLDFRKSMEYGRVIGFGHLEISTAPHYHFNDYQHNGNDFTPINAIESIIDILTYLGINKNEYNGLKVCNIEFGLNIIPETNIKTLVDGILMHKKTPFNVGNYPYFKISNATNFKLIKAYAKGLQFVDFPNYGIDINTFRFEVKSKQAKLIRKYGIYTADDLLKLETYQKLMQGIMDEWDSILLVNLTPNLSELKDLKKDEIQFVRNAKTVKFWDNLKDEKHRNTFNRNKAKYYNLLQGKNNLHTEIKRLIIDKLFQFSKCAYSTQRTRINKGKLQNDKDTVSLLNLEYAHFNKCMVTDLDISMQRKGSKYLCSVGLKFYLENQPNIYKKLREKFLTEDKKNTDLKTQFYYIAHNIRNKKTNAFHNRKRFEKRNYQHDQLQITF